MLLASSRSWVHLGECAANQVDSAGPVSRVSVPSASLIPDDRRAGTTALITA